MAGLFARRESGTAGERSRIRMLADLARYYKPFQSSIDRRENMPPSKEENIAGMVAVSLSFSPYAVLGAQ